jgi:peptidoglycan lytic transglycosylase
VKTSAISRALLLSCLAFVGAAIDASADPAPIEYAANTSPSQLAGGDGRSYGYGAAPRASDGAVVDIRRAAAATATAPTQDVNGQGRPGWLETERVGQPYQANGRWYVPTPEPGYSVNGTASWYGPNFHGQRGANGEVYDQEAMTAAHPTLPLNSLVQVTNLANGREVIVRVTDRGPFVGERVIDLSRAAAHVLGYDASGTARVNVRYLGPAPRRVNADGEMAAPDAPVPATAGEAPAQPPSEEGRPPLHDATRQDDGPVALAPAARQAPLLSRNEVAGDLAGAPATASGYFVQVGAFSDVDNAQRVRDAVGAIGPVVLDTRRNGAGMELFRVRLGPWQSRDAAETARQSLASMGYAESVVAAP